MKHLKFEEEREIKDILDELVDSDEFQLSLIVIPFGEERRQINLILLI